RSRSPHTYRRRTQTTAKDYRQDVGHQPGRAERRMSGFSHWERLDLILVRSIFSRSSFLSIQDHSLSGLRTSPRHADSNLVLRVARLGGIDRRARVNLCNLLLSATPTHSQRSSNARGLSAWRGYQVLTPRGTNGALGTGGSRANSPADPNLQGGVKEAKYQVLHDRLVTEEGARTFPLLGKNRRMSPS